MGTLIGEGLTYDDSEDRKAFIQCFKQVHNIELISNPDIYGIDLLFKNHPTGAGIEIENWKGYGDYRKKGKSWFLKDADPPYDGQTLNIPATRKEHYWVNGPHNFQPTAFKGAYRYTQVNASENGFGRINKSRTQIMFIPSEIINDETIKIISYKKTENIGTGDIEKWWSYPLKYVRFYHKKGNIWILEDINNVETIVEIIDGVKRAAEAYKLSKTLKK